MKWLKPTDYRFRVFHSDTMFVLYLKQSNTAKKMKTTVKTLLLSLFVAFSTFTVASDRNEKVVSSELEVQIQAIDDSHVMVRFQKLENEVVKVKIYDTFGTLIFSDKASEGSTYAKSFNLSAFPAGDYKYQVGNDVYTVTKLVEKK